MMDIDITNYCYYILLDIEIITLYSQIEKLKDYINSLFKANHIEISSKIDNVVNLDIINKEINELICKNISIEPTKLIYG